MLHPSPPPPSFEWCLFLDVDGTLLEMTDTPWQTTADAAIKSLLGAITERLNGAVALVSGRMILTLDQLFAPLHLAAAGLHGVERRRADGTMQGGDFIDPRLDRARAAIQSYVDKHPGTLLEDKDRTIALHFRMAPQDAESARQAIIDIAAPLGSDYHIQGGELLYEIKPRGFSKATAIEAFMSEAPFKDRRPVFIGDDLTDQIGFTWVENHGGISIGVGERVQGQYHLKDVNAVRRWLGSLAEP